MLPFHCRRLHGKCEFPVLQQNSETTAVLFSVLSLVSQLLTVKRRNTYSPVDKARNKLCWRDKKPGSRHVFYSRSGHDERGWRGACLFLQWEECLSSVFLPFFMLINKILFSCRSEVTWYFHPSKTKNIFFSWTLTCCRVCVKWPKRRTLTGMGWVTPQSGRLRTSGTWVGGNYLSRRAPLASTMEICSRPGHGAARSVRASGYRPGSRPGRTALQGRENCDSRHALPRVRLRTGTPAPGAGRFKALS